MDLNAENSTKNMTSSNECTSDDHHGTEDPSNCFLPPDPHVVHSTPSGIEGIIFDPSQHGCMPEESTSRMFPPESLNETALPADRDLEENDDQDSTISELSGLSDLSNFSTPDLKPDSGAPMSWVQKQMINGVDPRLILEELLPRGTCIPYNVNDGLLWRLIVNLLSEPKRSKLPNINTMDDVLNLLKSSKKVVVLTGAGVSVSCGIPDFRSRDGIYARLKKDYPALPDPQAMFDIQFFRRDPRPFFKFAKEIYPGQFEPSPSHRFIKVLEKQNKLLRNYTQNIDTLEHAAGIQNVITCHGSFATATCTVCGHKVDSSLIKEDVFNQTIPYCPICPAEVERGIMKPDIVFFGEGLSDEFHEALANDKEMCDLLIVMGSSLKVRPVAMIPSSVPTHVPQILINREPLDHLTFDVELLGDCDIIIGEICRRLESDWEIDERIPRYELKEILVHSSELNSGVTDSEVNNNSNPTNVDRVNLPQSDESNSCDCRGLSAIKLDDSEDGSNQEQPSSSTTVVTQEAQQPLVKNEKSPWFLNHKESLSKRIPDQSYLFVPPSRYVFTGAEVYDGNRHDDDDDDDDEEEEHCSTHTDYSSDCDSPLIPVQSRSTDKNCLERVELSNEQSSCKPEHSEEQGPSEGPKS